MQLSLMAARCRQPWVHVECRPPQPADETTIKAEMADQLREARRRRILENSEKRLQKILGHSANPDEEPISESPAPILEINPSSTVDQTIRNQQEAAHVRRRAPEENTEPTSQWMPEHGMTKQSSDIPSVTQQNSREVLCEKAENNLYLYSLCICFVAVASVCLLMFGRGALMGNNALVPFIILTIYKLAFIKLPEKQSSGLLGAAVMLSGVPTDMISKFSRILGIFSSIIQDLCLYLFICIISIQLFQAL